MSDTLSIRSRASSIFLKRPTTATTITTATASSMDVDHPATLLRPQKRLRWRDWLLALAELCMSFSWGSFIARAQSEETLRLRNMTPRDETIQRLFWNGFAAFGNLLMGQLADSYTRNYGIAVINIVGHFMLSSLFFMSEVISVSAKEAEYALLLSDIFVWLYIPIRATDFARYVYGMEQIVGSSRKVIFKLAFTLTLADQCGALLFLILNSSGVSFYIVAFVAFTCNGVVFYVYIYVLLPKKDANFNFTRGIALKMWGSVYTALMNRKKFAGRIKKKSWMDFAESKYEKNHVSKTKSLMKLFLLLLPTTGFLLFTGLSDDFFHIFWDELNQTGTANVYRRWAVNSATLLTMVFFEFIVMPLLKVCRIKMNFYRRFLLGYVALILALFFASITTLIMEKVQFGRDKAVIRIYNSKHTPVDVQSYDIGYSVLNYTVSNKSSRMVTYQTKRHRLMKVDIIIPDENPYVMHFSLEPYALVTYFFVDPNIVYRIAGQIPVLEGPPGFNDKRKPRCFVVNFIDSRTATVLDVTNIQTRAKTSVKVETGQVQVFQVEEGTYSFQVRDTLSRTEYEVLIGGVYGVYVYVDLDDYQIHVDKIIPENKTPMLMGLGVSIPMGIAKGVGMVALVAFVFTNSPEGLKGIATGFLFSLGQISSWILLFGFYTWHHYLSPYSLLLYSIIGSSLFFASGVLILKYRHLYKS
ncbi:hypothetical protein GE061_003624 [Apolygus lucorum]|uniref:Uncharacterized protein n=1 Tax=Apolygus lucorum TaxID=248454 RepID=A0A8S9X562_APOLU|nr:hypothetical protein GE061_003624 [Apolygus lucorum]